MSELAQEKEQRSASITLATAALDEEQASRVTASADADAAAEVERLENQVKAASLADGEQARRVEEERSAIEAEGVERSVNQAKAVELMNEEQADRGETVPDWLKAEEKKVPAERRLSAVHSELGTEVKEQTTTPTNAKASAVGDDDNEIMNSTASKNVSELMNTDADDESLQAYKAKLLGSAATGDLGDVTDKRRVVVAEFRVISENPKTEDQVYQLDTPEGVAKLKAGGITLKEGSGFKFQLKFKVNHDLLTRLKFSNKTKKAVFSHTESVVIGSFAPNSEAYKFTLPQNGFNYAPSGMMLRGAYTATDVFVDGDGENHLTYSYKVTITK
jgi:Rho GDP-dissociation inhibitor